MEQLLLKIIDASPVLGAFLIFWYFQRKDYIGLVEKTQAENLNREEKYQETIKTLSSSLNVVTNIQQDVKEIKDSINK